MKRIINEARSHLRHSIGKIYILLSFYAIFMFVYPLVIWQEIISIQNYKHDHVSKSWPRMT